MDHLDGTYTIGTDDESDDNNYVAPDYTGRQVAVNLGQSQVTVTSRRLANILRFRQEVLPLQPLAATSATASAAAAPVGPSANAADRSNLSQTLTRLVNYARDGPRSSHSTAAARDADAPRLTAEERSQADALWQSMSVEPPIWTWPAPAADAGFEPALIWVVPAPAGHTGYGIVYGEPLTGWEPNGVCNRQHRFPHLTLQQCISDYEKLFNGNERINGMVNGSIPISSFERLFFALWAARYHLLPRRTPDNHFEVRRPNEHTARFLGDLLHPSNRELPLLVNSASDDVTVGTPTPHFKVGDLRIALLRWYESCPAARQYLNDHLRDLFREHFADALDALRLRVYNVGTELKPKWKLPRWRRPMPSQEEDPLVWRIRPDRILDNENVIFADSWGVQFAPTDPSGNGLTIILSGTADRVIEKLKKYFLSNRVQNVYFFWGRDGLSDSSHDITPAWYSKLTEHFVRWFPHTRLYILLPPYTRENDHYWSHHIKRGVLANLRDHCLNSSVICDPMDLKLHDYHEQWMLRDGDIQFGYPPWPTEEQDTEGNLSVDGLRRRKTYMKELYGITLWEHEIDDSRNNHQQAAGQGDIPSGSSTAPATLQAARHGTTPPPTVGNDPDAALITRLREMFPNPQALQTQMLEMGRFFDVLHRLPSRVQTPTWRRVYPTLSNVEALNLWGAYRHLCYSTAPQTPDSDAETDRVSDSSTSDAPNPSSGHPSVANAAEGRRPSGTESEPRNPDRSTPPRPYCAFCDGHNHWSSDCPIYDLQARWALVNQQQLCHQCFHADHRTADCSRAQRRCLHCANRHHAALCARAPRTAVPAVQRQPPSDSGQPSAVNAAGGSSSSSPSLEASRNPGTGHPWMANAVRGRSLTGTIANRTSDNLRNPGLGNPSAANAAEGRRPPVSSDTIRIRTPSTEQRRGTPRASSRGPAAPRAEDLPWPAERHDW
ncbi:Zinc knuckle family protein [Aphelenchoides avenae]|nr:Zinc knuckle family protein [Aphelenchus avenae]